MNDNARHPNAPGAPDPQFVEKPQQQVIGPTDSLQEPVLAVDLARVELDQAIATAHRFPRRLDTIVRQLEQIALYDEAAAERCVYMLPRAGKAIVGPSIGFAHSLATVWGNCRDGARWVRTDRNEKVVVCEGAFFDLETNRQTIAPSVRRISGRNGMLFDQDMVAVTIQAANSIARRNAILNGVPRPIWHPTYEKALVIVRGTADTLADRRSRLVAAFAGFGIKAERVFHALGVKGETEISLDHIVMLRGMFEALKEGHITPEEMFDPRRMVGAQFDVVKDPLADDEHDDTAGMGQPAQRQAQAAQPQAGAAQPAQNTGPAAPAQAATPGAQEGQPAAKPKSRAGRPSNAEKARRAAAAAENSAGAAAQSPPASGAAGGGAAAESASPPKAAEPQAAQPAPAKTADAPPRDPAAYKAHLQIWLAMCTSASEVDDRWRRKEERDLRTNCRIIEDDFDGCRGLKDARIAELRKAG